MGEIAGLILILLVSAITTVALLVLLPFLIPGRVERTRQIIQTMPGRSFAIGLVNTLFFLVIAAIFTQGGDGGWLIALLIILALLTGAAIGLAGLVLLLRERIYPETAKAAGLSTMMKTAVLLTLAGLLPLLGWFVLTPILLLVGLGAAIMALVRRDGRAADSHAPIP